MCGVACCPRGEKGTCTLTVPTLALASDFKQPRWEKHSKMLGEMKEESGTFGGYLLDKQLSDGKYKTVLTFNFSVPAQKEAEDKEKAGKLATAGAYYVKIAIDPRVHGQDTDTDTKSLKQAHEDYAIAVYVAVT